ncbi:GNAT family N-acetyltransferase [Consotaella salsifontis]|uniref:Acetyltransferase (GNAT) family protein n=1 Tax=Consotaella salsifontis TaxID=1365950 RepID=A0A1T4QN86_9HYPH|nr:GNAT family N-acetyltransferase [Consotaella salsifontis]SKA04718.1 Acetyltransferase (GNAT) family protein [Consotaella salsifontis]
MATTEAERQSRLAFVRRLEAASLRAWPASQTEYDGTWVIRLTGSFPAKRLNSVNPLDPGDTRDFAARVERARERFAAFGRPLVFRLSPLAPPTLAEHLDQEGWDAFGESIVLSADLSQIDLSDALDGIPTRDLNRYVETSLVVHGRDPSLRPGLLAILQSIKAPAGMFIRAGFDGRPVAAALAVPDGDLAGVLDLAVSPAHRRQGIGRDLVRTTLRFALHKGASTAWLQVEADNEAGIELYRGLGFTEAYRYVYRAPAGSAQMLSGPSSEEEKE